MSEAVATATSPLQRLFLSLRRGEVAFALGLLSILILLIMPMPTWLLDISLAISITFSVIILMTSLFIVTPLEFSSFPTILLVSTMLRLGLNVASTRLILSHGHEGPGAAGHVIKAFGNFVMSGNFVIGMIVFAILVIVNFIVITKGSSRIAEVSARFTLDAMPGKQMAIDADLSAGIINEDQARTRRKNLEDESSFFGSMDGAAKFVRGDAVAGLLITFINIIGGVIIGVVQKGISFGEALHTYALLTVGDGLVSQIPALIVSTAAGLLVSKNSGEGSLDKALFIQLGAYPTAMGISSFVLGLISILPGIPMLPFIALSSMTGLAAWKMSERNHKEEQRLLTKDAEADDVKTGSAEKSLSDYLSIDLIRLEFGYGLLSLMSEQGGVKMTHQIKSLRKQLATDTGFVLPAVRIQDNLQLNSDQYVVRIKEIIVADGNLKAGHFLAIGAIEDVGADLGERTVEPTFGMPALWVEESRRAEAEGLGLTVVDNLTVIMTHLTEIIKENMPDLLSYADTQRLLDEVDPTHKKLVSDLVPGVIGIGGIQRVLQNLLGERVSIRDLPTILEGIAEAASNTKNSSAITELVRTRLSRQICSSCLNSEGVLAFLALSPTWDQRFQDSIVNEGDTKQLAMPPGKLQEFINIMKTSFAESFQPGEPIVLVTSTVVRPHVYALVERFYPNAFVLSQNEIHPKVKIRSLGQLT
ncbi:MAG: flagellar biosynthesis protein FlhA [Alphaproteobacteria bacterium 43-37]|nr:MAG: flagellar biosynthesis protein FlhA [Alphaproteobacteria bacterium 43-37]